MAASTGKYMFVGVYCEFLEVAFHNILFVRGIYPSSIFEKRKKYNSPVWRAIHPGVCSYIEQCITTIHKLLLKNEVERVVFAILDQSGNPIEQFVFEICMPRDEPLSDDSKFLLDLEEALKGFCLRIGVSNGLLKPNPKGSRFTIQLYTKEVAAVSMSLSDDPDFQSFPWIEADKKENEVNDGNIIPLKTMDCHDYKIQMYVIEGQKKTSVTMS